MADTLRLEIVTPEEKTFSGEVEWVVVPGIEGELGIYPMHVPVMTELMPGELRYRQGGEEHGMAVGAGFVEITQEHVTVLTDIAVVEEGMDENSFEAAIARAEASMKEREQLHTEQYAAVEASLERLIAQMRGRKRPGKR